MSDIRGIIIYNNRQDEELRTIYVSNSSVPVVFIQSGHGEHLSALLQEAELEVTISRESQCDHGGDGLTKCVMFVPDTVGEDDLSSSDLISHWDIVCISVALFLLTSFSLVCFLFYYLRKMRHVHKVDQVTLHCFMSSQSSIVRNYTRTPPPAILRKLQPLFILSHFLCVP